MAELADALDLGSSVFDVGVQVPLSAPYSDLREWLSGRALPCQGRYRGSESRLPLQCSDRDVRAFFCIVGDSDPRRARDTTRIPSPAHIVVQSRICSIVVGRNIFINFNCIKRNDFNAMFFAATFLLYRDNSDALKVLVRTELCLPSTLICYWRLLIKYLWTF